MIAKSTEQSPCGCSGTCGRVSRMVGREITAMQHTYSAFREAWTRRDFPRAAIAFSWLREALNLHMRWEEESLFEEFEKRCSVPELRKVRAHHFEHEAISTLTGRIANLLEQRSGAGRTVDDDLGTALCELDTHLREHQQIELDQICVPLDHVLSDGMLSEIETELCERGRL